MIGTTYSNVPCTNNEPGKPKKEKKKGIFPWTSTSITTTKASNYTIPDPSTLANHKQHNNDPQTHTKLPASYTYETLLQVPTFQKRLSVPLKIALPALSPLSLCKSSRLSSIARCFCLVRTFPKQKRIAFFFHKVASCACGDNYLYQKTPWLNKRKASSRTPGRRSGHRSCLLGSFPIQCNQLRVFPLRE